jgi:hypothetical protein
MIHPLLLGEFVVDLYVDRVGLPGDDLQDHLVAAFSKLFSEISSEDSEESVDAFLQCLGLKF